MKFGLWNGKTFEHLYFLQPIWFRKNFVFVLMGQALDRKYVWNKLAVITLDDSVGDIFELYDASVILYHEFKCCFQDMPCLKLD